MNGERAPNEMAHAAGGSGRRGEWGRDLAEWCTSVSAVTLAVCLLLAWGVSMAAPLLNAAGGGSLDWLPGAGGYLAVVLLLALLVRKTRRFPEHRVVGGLIALSAGIKLWLAVRFAIFPLHADQELFHRFVRDMADSRLNPDILRVLSAFYDYPVWAGRVLPIHYLIRLAAGPGDVFWTRLLNVGVSSAMLAVVYGFSRRLLPEGKRRWAVFLMMALPFQTMVVTDYSHHLLSSFYFLSGLWCAWELVFRSPRAVSRLGLSLGAGGCLLLMMWQRGTHWIALGTWLALLAWAGLRGTGLRRWAGLAVHVVGIPLLVSLPLARGYDAWLERQDAFRLNSVLPAFMARGWCPETGGEYCGRYEQLDRATPPGEKTAAMLRLVGSQIRFNSRTVCLWFPAMKTAKLFLVGYASNFEESLAAAGSDALPAARGMRRAAAPLFLGLALWGCLALARRPGRHPEWLPVVLAPLVTWGAYVFFGETSPRYSIFCQPFLALLGALGIPAAAARPPGSPGQAVSWKAVAARAGVAPGIIAVCLALLVGLLGAMPAHRFYGDLSQGWTVSGGGRIGPGALHPFEAVLNMDAGQASAGAEWSGSGPAGVSGRLSFYLLNMSAEARALTLEVAVDGDERINLPLADVALPRRLEAAGPFPRGILQLELRSPEALPQPAWVSIGYAGMDPGRADK